jgi:hypothetical protein
MGGDFQESGQAMPQEDRRLDIPSVDRRSESL